MAKRLKRVKGLIPRYKLPIVHREAVKGTSSGNPWGGDENAYEYTFTKGVAEVCTLQQPSPNDLTPQEQGLSQDEILMLRTDTPVYGSSEGTDFLGTSVYIPSSWWGDDSGFSAIGKGGWFTVTKPYRHGSDVISHYQAMLVRDSSAVVTEYPDITLLTPEVDTREKYLSGDWEDVWLN